MSFKVIHGNALDLPLEDDSVDLIVTSPPYFALRSYRDGDEHYGGQIGSEATPQEFLEALWAATREMMRVLKPSGSIFVNLGDSYSGSGGHNNSNIGAKPERGPKSYRKSKWGVSEDGRPHEWTRENAAWLAGVIDCDGSISIHQNKTPEGHSDSFVGWVRIGQMDREVVDRAAAITGLGNVFQDKRGVWSWSVSAQQARWVLQRIFPWLLIKQRQALGVIELARHVEDRKARGQWSPLTEADVEYRRMIKTAVQAWNKRQAFEWEPPAVDALPLPHYLWQPPAKSLHGLPWRYAIGCVDQLGLILRAEIIWSKPNGLPESVTDRVRRSHEQWFHMVKSPRYFSAVDEIREAHNEPDRSRPGVIEHMGARRSDAGVNNGFGVDGDRERVYNPLGKLPGSVWTIPSEPLIIPEHLGLPDHFAAFPQEWPRRIILGWSPTGICTACGEGRRPVVEKEFEVTRGKASGMTERDLSAVNDSAGARDWSLGAYGRYEATITGYACACTPYEPREITGMGYGDSSLPPTRPAVVLDPFGGTGTVAGVAHALGRHGISVDLSADYCRLAEWRISRSGHFQKAYERTAAQGAVVPMRSPRDDAEGRLSLFDETP